MAKAAHYSKANLLWTNTAYCDQWKRVMAVYGEHNELRAVIKPDVDIDCSAKSNVDINYNVLLIGDDSRALYKLIGGINLGSTHKNMISCFNIYHTLQGADAPPYVPSYRETQQIELHSIFPHTRVGAIRTGGFRVTTDDISDKIAYALRCYDEIVKAGVNTYCCSDWEDDTEDYYSDYPESIYNGEIDSMMYHVGCGAYCDDDGDNWDFL